MAATLDTAPDSPILNGNDNWVILETDLVSADPAYIELTFSSSGPVAAEEIDITFDGTTITFTVAATTNATATAIPTKDGGESLTEYAERVAEAFRENGQITDVFAVTSTGAVVRLEALTGSAIADLATTGTLTNTVIADDTGASPYTEENLAAALQVWIAGATANDDTRLATLHATYNPSTAQAEFNLRNLFPVQPVLPNPNTINPVVSLTWPHDEATGAWVEYFLRFADKYGTPAIPEALVRTPGNYHVIHGHKPDDFIAPGAITFVDRLHGYTRLDGGAFDKRVTSDTPDWVYIWTKANITSANVEFEITWDNGDITTETTGDPFSLDQYKVYWFSAGPLQRNFAGITPPAADAQPWKYKWRLKGNAGLGVATLLDVRYIIRPCTAWDRFLLFDNGRGGCETVLMHGRNATGYKAARTVARRQRGSGHDISLGDQFTFNQEGQQQFVFNTGLQEKWYIEHLQQLLLAEAAWLIDTDNEVFLRLMCDTDSIDVKKDDQELFSLSVAFNAAWIDQARNH